MRGMAVSTRPRTELEVLAYRVASQDLASFGYLNKALPDDLVGWRGREVEVAESRDARMRAQDARQ